MQPPRPAPAACAVAMAAGLLFFSVFAADLLLHGPVTRADLSISAWFQAHATPALTRLLFTVTRLHGTLAVCLAAALIGAVLLLTQNRAWLPALLVCVPGGLLLNAMVKHMFDRARPSIEHPLFTLTSSSFPSGHTAGATVLWGLLLVLWWSRQPGTAGRLAGCAVAVTIIALTALSRVYLGAHYASDVLAAMGEGTAWLGLGLLLTADRSHISPG